MPKDPILLSIIPEGLNSDLIQELLEDDDLNRLARMIAVLEGRVAEMSVEEKHIDVKPLTSLIDEMRKLVMAKAELEIQRHNLVPIEWVKQVFDVFTATLYEVIDDPHKQDEFLAKVRPKIRGLHIVKPGRRPGKTPEFQLLESPGE